MHTLTDIYKDKSKLLNIRIYSVKQVFGRVKGFWHHEPSFIKIQSNAHPTAGSTLYKNQPLDEQNLILLDLLYNSSEEVLTFDFVNKT